MIRGHQGVRVLQEEGGKVNFYGESRVFLRVVVLWCDTPRPKGPGCVAPAKRSGEQNRRPGCVAPD